MGAAQVPTNVGMPPKDGTPCISGACRGGFGRADPGQPRCDWPETWTHQRRIIRLYGFGFPTLRRRSITRLFPFALDTTVRHRTLLVNDRHW
jgi:hypothetical protein